MNLEKVKESHTYVNLNSVCKWGIDKITDGTYILRGFDARGHKICSKTGFDTEEAALDQLMMFKKDVNKELREEMSELRKEINELKEMIKTLPVVCGTDYLEAAKRDTESGRVKIE